MTIDQILLAAKDKWGYETVQAIKNKLATSGYGGGPLQYNGTLINSIKYTPSGQLDGDNPFSMVGYGRYLDEGTGPQGPQARQIPEEKVPGIAYYLKDWANSKSLNPWAVAWSIQKRGLKPRKFFGTVIEARLDDLKIAFDDAYKSYLDDLINRQQNP